MRAKAFLPILAALILAVLLCACVGGGEERTEHERLFLVPGEEVTLRLKNIPEDVRRVEFCRGEEIVYSYGGQ